MPSSGQGGPCCHCGRTHSCCWRRGPVSKPILCNACGSRYLVKRSLDGYQPLQTRREASGKQQQDGVSAGRKEAASASRRSVGVAPAGGRVTKPKRVVQKRLDSDAWNSENEDSEASDTALYMTDDSAASRRASARLAGAAGAAAAAAAMQQALEQLPLPGRQPSERSAAAAAASKLQLSYITTHSQLKELGGLGGSADFSSIAGAFFASSLRLKPRKPVVVTVSAVW